MDAFLGFEVLTELLIMGRVGVYVDSPVITGTTLAETGAIQPYLYMYPIENILSWSVAKPHQPSEFQSILLKDTFVEYNSPIAPTLHGVDLPCGELSRYRLVWINEDTGFVNVQFYDDNGAVIDPETNKPSTMGPIELNLRHIPFIMFDIGDSLLKDVCKHQIALLNLGSSDVSYALKSNFPFYTEQSDLREIGSHLKTGQSGDNTASEGGQGGLGTEISVGATQGRAYDMGAERPKFINPSPEPLLASLKLQEKLENDIRKLVNLAVSNVANKPISAQSKDLDNQGLEAGLSFIGLILETGERKITSYWSAYEQSQVDKQEIALIKYPARYSLKRDVDRIEEAERLSKLMTSVPGKKVKRELAKVIVDTLLSGKVTVDELEAINKEISVAPYTTSDPEIIVKAVEAGLVGEKTASIALGFEDNEYLVARKDHMARVRRIAISQAQGEGVGSESDGGTPGARGVDDLEADNAAAKGEKEVSQNTAAQESKKSRTRGEGK